MSNTIKKILAVIMASVVFLFTVACGTASPNKEPIYCVDGNTIIKDIDGTFKYYTEGLSPIFNEDGGADSCFTNDNVRQYMYFPSEYKGEAVKASWFDWRNKDGSKKIIYMFLSEGIEESYFVHRRTTYHFSVVIPKSMRVVGKDKDRWDNVFYLGTPEEFSKVEFPFLPGILSDVISYFGEEYFQHEYESSKNGAQYGYKENPTPTPVYYYSDEEPTESGKYWRYVDGLPTVWE